MKPDLELDLKIADFEGNTECIYSDNDSNFEEEDLITLDQFNPITPNPIHRDIENPTIEESGNDKKHQKNKTKKTKQKVILKRVLKGKLRKKELIQKLLPKKRPLKKHGVEKQDGVAKQDGDSNVQTENAEYVTRTYKKGKHKDDELFDEFFKIDTLTLQQQKDEFVRRKETANYSNSKWRCEFCFKGFMHERAYDAHMQKHTEVIIGFI